jgi:hypothetical protein
MQAVRVSSLVLIRAAADKTSAAFNMNFAVGTDERSGGLFESPNSERWREDQANARQSVAA